MIRGSRDTSLSDWIGDRAGVRRVYTYDREDWDVFVPDGMLIAGPPSVLPVPTP
jgi:hypothetical protein